MNEFEKKLKRRLNVSTFICLFSVILYLLLNFLTKTASDFAQGISMGVFVGIELVSVYMLVSSYTALNNKEKLKEMYINETDERNMAIAKETSQKSALISMIGIALATIVAGFFDKKICLLLCAVVFFDVLVTVLVSMYYKKKM